MKPALMYSLIAFSSVLFIFVVLILTFWLKGRHFYKQHKRDPVIVLKSLPVVTSSTPTTKPVVTTDATTFNDEVGALHVNSKRILLEPGWMVKHFQWNAGVLYFSAFDMNQSGTVFRLVGDHAEACVQPISGKQEYDMFGFTFHLNKEYLAVAHMKDRTVHVFQQIQDEFHVISIVDPNRETSMFPYSVAITTDGSRLFMGNPTESIGAQRESGTVIMYQNETFTDIFSTGTSWFGKSLHMNESNELMIGDESVYYKFLENRLEVVLENRLEVVLENRLEVVLENRLEVDHLQPLRALLDPLGLPEPSTICNNSD